MNSQSPQNEPDPDAIKMFVGQIPRYMDENDLQKLFAEFGPVFQLNVLRDKSTGHSKGCCFVTFYTRRAALEAQNSLHNVKTLSGMQHPIQMKPADSEKRVEDRKLFIGMLSKKCNENDVRMMFSPFGTIEECTVLREQNGQSRGCAFITFASRQCAQNAIRNLHHSRTLEGCRSPLVVKLADSHQEKEMKRLQQMQAQLLNGASLGALSQQYLALLQQSATGGNMGAQLGNLGNSGLGFNALQMQQILSAAASASLPGSVQNSQGDVSGLHNLATLAAFANKFPALGPTNMNALQHLAGNNIGSNVGLGGLHGLNSSQGGMNMSCTSNSVGGGGGGGGPLSNMSSLHNSLPGIGGSDGLAGMMAGNGMNGLASAGLSTSGPGGLGADGLGGGQAAFSDMQQQYAGISGLLNPGSFSNALSAQTMSQLQHAAAGNQLQGSLMNQYGGSLGGGGLSGSAAGKQTEGPEGSNLFIYHLPQEYGDQELMAMFLPYGNVISSKVYIDKQTNLSKCFGFVSYDSPISAQNAIQAMNGYQVGVKRLKVQLKRPKTDAKLY